MQLDKMWVILRREYVTRLQTKSFWISTLTVPLLMAAMTILPSLLLVKAKGDHRLVVVDETGLLAAPLLARLTGTTIERSPSPETETDSPGKTLRKQEAPGQITFQVSSDPLGADPEAQRAALEKRVLAGEIDSWLWLTREGIEKGEVEYHAESVSNFITQERLSNAVSAEVRHLRLTEAGFDPEKVSQLTKEVDLKTLRTTADGAREEAGFASFFFVYFLFFLLYMMVLLYGQQVMNGVLEEKSTRSMEVLVATVRPFELMLGKLVGVCLVGMTQLGIWLTAVFVLTSPGILPVMAALPGGMPQLSLSLIFHFFVCFVLGFFLYGSIYAAIGACFNNLQEAQQFASIAAMVVVVPVVLFFPISNDPNSTLAVITSLVPLFTPLLMLARIAVKMPPLWQIALGYALTAGTTLAIVWASGRIYRIGILMYGKKPTMKEIVRWVRYA
jgi:ABC-2 type transport system permease protein